jgi:hypothetical protein
MATPSHTVAKRHAALVTADDIRNEKRHLMVHNRAPSVSVIVPSYNEHRAVARVVESVLSCRRVSEVICVDDGSTDGTPDILRSFGERIVLVQLPSNRGKGFALVEGLSRAHHPIVAFVDADLPNLSTTHLDALLAPIQDGDARAVVGYPCGRKLEKFYALTPVGRGWMIRIAGERAYFRDDLIPHMANMAKSRFGVEMYLNAVFRLRDTKVVSLAGLTDLYKYEKHPAATAMGEFAGEAGEMAIELLRGVSRRCVGGIRGRPLRARRILSRSAAYRYTRDVRQQVDAGAERAEPT